MHNMRRFYFGNISCIQINYNLVLYFFFYEIHNPKYTYILFHVYSSHFGIIYNKKWIININHIIILFYYT